MIPAWIIEEIRKEEQEREEQRERQQERLPLEAPQYYPYEETSPPPAEPSDRGVVIIQY